MDLGEPRVASRGLRRNNRAFLARLLVTNAKKIYDLIVLETSSHVTVFLRKYDSFAMWQAMAA
jgi:hypothetical protein